MNHIEQARTIYADLRDMRMADMKTDQWNLFLALEPLFDPAIAKAHAAHAILVHRLAVAEIRRKVPAKRSALPR